MSTIDQTTNTITMPRGELLDILRAARSYVLVDTAEGREHSAAHLRRLCNVMASQLAEQEPSLSEINSANAHAMSCEAHPPGRACMWCAPA